MFSYSLAKYPVVELMDHMVVLFLIFWGTSVLFSPVIAPACIPTNSERGFLLHILTKLVVSFVFDFSYPDMCEVISHCLDLHFLDSNTIIQFKNGQQTWTDIFPKKTSRRSTDTSKKWKWDVLKISVKSICPDVSFKVTVSLLISVWMICPLM